MKIGLLREVEHAESTPVDFKFIESVVRPILPKIHMINHESLKSNPDLAKDVMKGDDAVCILMTVLHHSQPTNIRHWTCLFKGPHGYVFFDSLNLNLKKLYALTGEENKLLYALRHTKFEQSHTALQKMISKQKYCGTAVSCRLRYTHMTNTQFERHILSYDRSSPGKTMTLMTLFHYRDQREYEKGDKYLVK